MKSKIKVDFGKTTKPTPLTSVIDSTRVPSPYQQRIYEHVKSQLIGEAVHDGHLGLSNAIIKAVAGSGKTTTLVDALRLTQHQAIFLAFNKSIAEELKRRVPSNVQARTFHSLCYRPVLQALGAREVNQTKLREVIATVMTDPYDIARYGSFVRKLVGLAKSDGLGCLKPADEENLMALVDQHDLTFEHDDARMEKGIEFTRRALDVSNGRKDADFDDLLYFSVLKGIALPKFWWVFVDEAQDTNAIQRAILKKIVKDGGRLIAVGDPAQAIYGFRGADSNALDLIAKDFAPCLELPLSVTYRCPLSVVKEAKQYVKDIEPRPNAPEGKVDRLDRMWALKDFGPHDLVVCRYTRPVIELGYKLMMAKIPLRIMGRDIGESLIKLITKCSGKDGSATFDEFLANLEKWETRESEKALAKGNEAKAESIHDKADAIEMLAAALPEDSRTIGELIRIIQTLFTEVNSRVTLSTIHKAKGLEADTVWWLNPSSCPSRWAKQPWQQQQERNLMYVAVTRAKERLCMIEMPRNGDVPIERKQKKGDR